MKILAVVLAVVVVVVVVVACTATRAGYESAGYEVLSRDGPHELRRYPDIAVASTPMGGRDPNDSGAFMRLFRYISKGNEAEEKIAMTTPVFMTGDEAPTMHFVVPAEVAAAGAPEPVAAEVTLGELPGGRFAVYRYRGNWQPGRTAAAKEKLAAWVAEEGLSPVGGYVVAHYDPPFTPPFLRRNEVLVRVAAAPAAAAGDDVVETL